MKHESRLQELEEEVPSKMFTPCDYLIKKEKLKNLFMTINNILSPREADLVFWYYQGYTHKEIAKELNISYDNTRKLFLRAMKKLHNSLKEKGDL